MKKILLRISIIMSVMTSVFVTTSFAYENVTIKVNDRILSNDAMIYFENDRVLVPYAPFLEALGARSNLNEYTKTVTASKNGINLQITVDSSLMYVNNETAMLDVPARICEDSIVIPIRAVSEMFGAAVNWDNGIINVVMDAAKTDDPITKELTIQDFDFVTCHMSFEDIEDSIGQPSRYEGSGLITAVYDLSNGDTVFIQENYDYTMKWPAYLKVYIKQKDSNRIVQLNFENDKLNINS